MDDVKISSNRSFGILFFIVFLIISFYPIINNDSFRLWSLIVSLVFVTLGILNSRILTPLNLLWFKFGILLGKIIQPIVMGLVFFIVVTPTSLIMKMFCKDLLGLKRHKKKSYWVERSSINSKMKNQF